MRATSSFFIASPPAPSRRGFLGLVRGHSRPPNVHHRIAARRDGAQLAHSDALKGHDIYSAPSRGRACRHSMVTLCTVRIIGFGPILAWARP
jgi:hypothetical protein